MVRATVRVGVTGIVSYLNKNFLVVVVDSFGVALW